MKKITQSILSVGGFILLIGSILGTVFQLVVYGLGISNAAVGLTFFIGGTGSLMLAYYFWNRNSDRDGYFMFFISFIFFATAAYLFGTMAV
jgi:uncharacterized membrane protein